LCIWELEEAKDPVVGSMGTFVGVRMLDGLEWGFGPLARVKIGLEVREGVLFSGGLSRVEIVRGIGWFVTYYWTSESPMLTVTGSSPRKGPSGGLQWGRDWHARA
jgi:hypothetical protein